jgi:hypothetical protein
MPPWSCRPGYGEIVALDSHGAPDFAAIQAALSEGKTKDLVFFAGHFNFRTAIRPHP